MYVRTQHVLAVTDGARRFNLHAAALFPDVTSFRESWLTQYLFAIIIAYQC